MQEFVISLNESYFFLQEDKGSIRYTSKKSKANHNEILNSPHKFFTEGDKEEDSI